MYNAKNYEIQLAVDKVIAIIIRLTFFLAYPVVYIRQPHQTENILYHDLRIIGRLRQDPLLSTLLLPTEGNGHETGRPALLSHVHTGDYSRRIRRL